MNVADNYPLTKLVEKMKFENLTPQIDTDDVLITQPDINRPALQLAGFFDHFDNERVQIIGFVEKAYLDSLDIESRKERYRQLLSFKVPCIVFCRDIKPDLDLLEMALKYNVPILSSKDSTSSVMAEIIRWQKVMLAPVISIHGVLVDVYGEGVLIMGESGIGKSEAALELIRRGHRLISDDVVEIHKVSDDTLIGTSPDITKYLIELRGIGIIDVKSLYGVEKVKETQSIDMVIKLEEWSKEAKYDRFGMEDETVEFLGNKVVCHSIPIRPGRNTAIIVETAAVNHRQKKMGYNAAEEFYKRIQARLEKAGDEG
ncbi:MAG TPA: HPr(Ser) kinase/phosphatase [Eubacterium sp.]|nr:HPr(Ser) kinase/phosphatase [Eubacterium sp.]